MKLLIAADLHDIGKLAVPNSILDSPSKFSRTEFEIVKSILSIPGRLCNTCVNKELLLVRY